MAMSTGTANGQMMAEMNTTPLIDVMLVLLVLLIVTLPIQTHAVKIDMPAGPPQIVERTTVNLAVDFDGTVTWNGTAVDRGTLDSYLKDAARQNPQLEIHIRANRLANYDAVSRVLADAQRLGATHIGFTGVEQYN